MKVGYVIILFKLGGGPVDVSDVSETSHSLSEPAVLPFARFPFPTEFRMFGKGAALRASGYPPIYVFPAPIRMRFDRNAPESGFPSASGRGVRTVRARIPADSRM